jgi:serine phosphatase RsbU (regulator of sigma subunit)
MRLRNGVQLACGGWLTFMSDGIVEASDTTGELYGRLASTATKIPILSPG